MEKLAVLAMTFLFALSVVQGQTTQTDKKEVKKEAKAERVALRKLEGTVVSAVSRNTFITTFGNLPNVQWKREGTYDEVAFIKDGHPMKAYFDIEGELVGTTEPKTFADLPVKGQQEITKRYKDYKAGPVLFFDDNENNDTDMILYGIQFDDADNYFIEMTKGQKKIVLQVNMEGSVFYFTQL